MRGLDAEFLISKSVRYLQAMELDFIDRRRGATLAQIRFRHHLTQLGRTRLAIFEPRLLKFPRLRSARARLIADKLFASGRS